MIGEAGSCSVACPFAGKAFAIDGSAGTLAAEDSNALGAALICATGNVGGGAAVTKLLAISATLAVFRGGRLIPPFKLTLPAAQLPNATTAELPPETVADDVEELFTVDIAGVDNPRCAAASVDANPPLPLCTEPACALVPGIAARLPAGTRLLEMDSNPRFTALTRRKFFVGALYSMHSVSHRYAPLSMRQNLLTPFLQVNPISADIHYQAHPHRSWATCFYPPGKLYLRCKYSLRNKNKSSSSRCSRRAASFLYTRNCSSRTASKVSRACRACR
jgi:hypothetical protein